MAKRNGKGFSSRRGSAPAPSSSAARSKRSGGFGSCVIVLAIIVAVSCIVASSVLRFTSDDVQEPVDREFFHTGAEGVYDWSKLNYVNGRFAYYDDGRRMSRFGIDVSDSQGYIEWADVAADEVDFAMIRCGYRGISDGGVYNDQCFEYNIESAMASGIDVGVYFYSQAITEEEAVEEAKLCLELINGRDLQYPVAYDFEESMSGNGRADGISVEQATANARAFCKVIEDAGYDTIVYGNQHDLNDYDPKMLDEMDIWYAEYGSSAPTSGHKFSIWQYSNEGSVDGISTVVDLNIDLSAV